MSNATIIPATIVKITLTDATLDLVCFEYASLVLGDKRKAGKLKGYVEASFNANQGLADMGAILPIDSIIHLPEYIIIDDVKTQRLWD